MVTFSVKYKGCHEALEHPPEAEPEKVVYVVAVLLLDAENRILLAQRPKGKKMAGLWEFPGGKIEQGESPEYALMRELREELAIETRPCCFAPVTFASHHYDDFQLFMPLFVCRVWEGIPKAQEGQTLKWVRAKHLENYEMPAADIPLIQPIKSYLGHSDE